MLTNHTANTNKYTYVIGDIHGNYKELITLMKNLKNIKKIIFLGDYINKGDNSREVLLFLMNLKKSNKFETIFLTGNHEYNLLKQDILFLNKHGGEKLIKSYLGTEEKVTKHNLDSVIKLVEKDKSISFLTDTKLFHEDKKFFYLHAGFNPKYNKINEVLNNDPNSIFSSRFDFLQSKKLLNDKRVIFGHTAFNYPYIDKFKIGINTGNTITAFCYELKKFINSNYEIYDIEFAIKNGGKLIINEK